MANGKKTNRAIKVNDDFDMRRESRRPIYLGENVKCILSRRGKTLKCIVVDLSTKGVALITAGTAADIPFKVDETVTLELQRKHQLGEVKGIIANFSNMKIQGKNYQRIGIKFGIIDHERMDDFTSAIGSKIFACKTYIRPQISCLDPFFFNEVILFQVNGFTATGIDLISSSRWKSILPGQSLDLDVFIPGKGIFKITCKNSHHYYHSPWKGRFRLYLEYQKADQSFNDAVVDYLLTINSEATPSDLRENGFKIGILEQSCHLGKTIFTPQDYPSTEFKSSLLAAPSLREDLSISPKAREMYCKIGANRVAYFNLVFFTGTPNHSTVDEMQEDFPRHIISVHHVVVTNLLVSEKASITDFLMPMLQQIVRISAQSKSKFVIVEADKVIVNVLKHIGFTTVKLVDRVQDKSISNKAIMSLEVNAILSNRQLTLDNDVWRKLYKRVNHFLGRIDPGNTKVKTFNFDDK